MPKNYYIILGIPKSSTQKDIRAAYRRLAKEFHPDRYGKDQAPFQIIQEAYAILSNPESRKSYDHSLQPKSRVNSTVRHTFNKRSSNIHIEPLVPESHTRFSNQNAFTRSFRQQRSTIDDVFGCFAGENQGFYDSKMMLPQDISVEISLTPIQAQIGGNVRVDLPIPLHCSSCHRYSEHGFVCRRCNGTGILRGEKPILIRFPAGIQDNHVIKISLHPHDIRKIYLNVIFKIF